MFSCCVSTNKGKSRKSKLKSKELLIDTDTDDGTLDVKNVVDTANQQEDVDATDVDKTSSPDTIQSGKTKCDNDKNGIERNKEDEQEQDVKQCDCDVNLKPSTAAELERLVGRLERIVDRLERSVSARELELANKALNSILSPRKSLSSPSPPLPPPPSSQPQSLTIKDYEQDFREPPLPLPPPLTPSQLFADSTDQLEQRIISLQNSLTAINSRRQSQDEEIFLPTVITHTFAEAPEPTVAMSVAGYEDIIFGPLAQYLQLSAKIGGDVATHAEMVKKAFNAQLEYVKLAQSSAQPPQDRQMSLLQPTSEQISNIQTFREKSRTSPFFNHLSAISESIPALGWVCVAPTPGPHVKEMNDAGQFYTNRVLKDWKEKDASHVEWARSWIQTLTDLQKYIRQYHTTGLVWSGKSVVSGGGAPPPPPPGCPPPPPVMPMADLSLGAEGDERSALFAQINRGEDITKSLKKVTSDMQTHKNPTLRTGPAPFVTPQPFNAGAKTAAPSAAKPISDKPPVFSRDGKKWLIEYQKSNPSLLVDNAEMNNVVYMFRCEGSNLTVKGKINSIVIDSCKKCCVVFDSLVSSVEFVNCQSVQMQVLGKVPTISIDKTDGCQMYLSNDSLEVEVISSKSSEMNVLIPNGSGDYTEQPIPEQFKTTIKGKSLKTICVESLG